MKAQITRKNINLPKYFVVNYVRAGTRCSLQYLILLKSKTVNKYKSRNIYMDCVSTVVEKDKCRCYRCEKYHNPAQKNS